MSRSTSAGRRQLLRTLEGRNCPVCTSGELVREPYKGNAAVVCEDCGTPRVQVWSGD